LAFETPDVDSTKNTVCIFTDSKMGCQPHSDGYPGGYVSLELVGSAKNSNNSIVVLDSLYWEINKNDVLVETVFDSILWHPTLIQDTNSISSIYNIPLITRSIDGFLGKTDITIYINQEINEKPSVVKINGQSSQAVINIFENSFDSLVAVVTDPELCSLVSMPCNLDNLEFKSDFFDNSSPFVWKSDSSNLLSSINVLVPTFRAPQIDPQIDIGANFIRDTLEFQFKATDPFGESDSQIVTIIVHNKNQKPIIRLKSANISEIDLIAGYSFELVVAGNEIELHEYDASGEQTETTLVAEISDVDNDQTFTIYPQGNYCETGFVNNYCVSGTTIKTDQNIFSDLVIPFMVDDGVSSPIAGFISDSVSVTSDLIIQKIKNITHSVSFSPIIAIEDTFHLPEDSTEIEFSIIFKLDGKENHVFNTDSLNWTFHKLDNESVKRVFASKTTDEFIIDSVYSDFNGQTGLKVVIQDTTNASTTLTDSIIIDIPIYIDQRNDAPELLSIVKIADTEYDPSNETIHLVEDTSPVEFTIKVIDIDSDNLLNKDIRYELKELEWEFSSLIVKDSMTVNVFNEFKEQLWVDDVIDSLLTHYNGFTNLNVVVTDDSLKKDTLDIPIYIDQKNDAPVISSVDFDDAIEFEDNYYHLAEDTSNVKFRLKVIDIDFNSFLNNDTWYDLGNLDWGITSLDSDGISRVTINTEDITYDADLERFVLEINSLYEHFNGPTSLEFRVDDQNTVSAPFTLDLFIDQRNDAPVISSVDFDDAIELDNSNYYHLAEDTSNVEFRLQVIDIDADGLLNNDTRYDLGNLDWGVTLLDTESILRVNITPEDIFYDADLNIFVFKIDSVYSDFNGATGLKVIATDDGGVQSIKEIFISLDQRNDAIQQFSLHTPIKEYSIDSTTLDSVREILYFRLPQNNEGKSYSSPKELRFQWEKNDTLDVDTDSELNLGDSLHLYYRLEAVVNDSFYIILKDSIDHGDDMFVDEIAIFADINMTNEFSYYLDEYEINPNKTITLDTTGNTSYNWRVVAQNYWKDDFGNDPKQVSSGWESTDFKIDLIQPKATDFNIMINELYPGYYDLLWNSSEPFLSDSTFLNIKEASNKFGAISFRNPRRIIDNLYHFTGIIPAGITSAAIEFELQMRDNAMNSGESNDEVTYFHITPDYASLLTSPSGNMVLSIPKSGIDKPRDILITEDEFSISTERILNELQQISPIVNFFPTELSLNQLGLLSFDISNYLSSEVFEWQFVIMKINEEEPQQLSTYFKDDMITTNITELGNFAVFVNSNIDRPLPTKFELKANYPNPFNPTTVIPLEIPAESYVKASIYNILGQEVLVLLEGIQKPGYSQLIWNGTNQFGQQMSSGIYFIRVHYGKNIYHQKMMLLK